MPARGARRSIRSSSRHLRFRVIASNNDGVWNETGATLAFTVAPAWFQTLWFRSRRGLASASILLAPLPDQSASGGRGARRAVRRAARRAHAHRTRSARHAAADGPGQQDGRGRCARRIAADPERMRRAMEQLSEWLGQAVREGRAALNSLRTSSVASERSRAGPPDERPTTPARPPSMAVSVVGHR